MVPQNEPIFSDSCITSLHLAATMAVDPLKEKALADYKKKLMEHREVWKKKSGEFVNEYA